MRTAYKLSKPIVVKGSDAKWALRMDEGPFCPWEEVAKLCVVS